MLSQGHGTQPGSRSSSSAFTSDRAPLLSAEVHRVGSERIHAVPLSDLKFRPLESSDFEAVAALHKEWFPVAYEADFFRAVVGGQPYKGIRFTSMVATYSFEPHVGGAREHLFGCVLLTTSLGQEDGTVDAVFGCRSRLRLGPCGLACIFTLGIIDEYRRKGLARVLLRRAAEHVEKTALDVGALYLNVISYNAAAVRLYEAEGFMRVLCKPKFYQLDGHSYDAYLYARYVNGARPCPLWQARQWAGATLQAWRGQLATRLKRLCSRRLLR